MAIPTLTHVPDIGVPLGANSYLSKEPDEPNAPPEPLPDWLSAAPSIREQTVLPRYPATRQQLALEERVFSTIFESILDEIVAGGSVRDWIKSDPREINNGRFRRWIAADKERTQRYEEAQRIGTEEMLDICDEIAKGSDSMEDIERSKLRLKWYEFKIRSWNKQRYGAEKEISQPFGQQGIVINISAVESPYVKSGNIIEHTP